VFAEGDGGLPPTCPPELIESFNRSENVLKLLRPDGGEPAEVIFRAIGDEGLGRIKNITLAGAFIDQAEELDAGDGGERMYDEILGRLSDPRGPRKIVLASNPGSTLHWVYHRFVKPSTREPQTRRIHVRLTDAAEVLTPDYLQRMLATKEKRPHWYRARILGEWGSFEGAAYEEFEEGLHAIRPFDVPEHWSRFESIDFGHNNPTAYLVWMADEDGNLVVADEYHSPGLASEHAPQILGRRKRWGMQGYPYCYSDPSMWSEYGLTNKREMPASIATELNDHGVTGLIRANNDRAAGYLRLRELLHPEPGRIPPPWARLANVAAAPRLYIFEDCTNLIEQLKNAPTTTKGRSVDIGDTVDPDWETRHGHAHAAARYGAMSRPRPAGPADSGEPDDWKSWKQAELLRKHDERVENRWPGDRYKW
jgi:hypothetical protein